MRIHARHYETADPLTVTVDAGLFSAIEPGFVGTADRVADWLAPSFFDIQVNGALGVSFNSPSLSVDDVHRAAEFVFDHNVGGFCPTLITADFAALEHGFRTLARACDADRDLNRRLPGFHLEGPYISGDDGPRGAHPREPVRDPNWDEFCRWQDAAGGRIRLVTLAPERQGALPFIERLRDSGIVPAIGHTAATADQLRDAIAAGARISTHLGNGAHAVLPRHPNYIWEQLAADGLWASVIADGHHLAESVLKCILRVKTPQRTVLTSDASALAGLPPGHYALSSGDCEVLAEGKVVVAGTRLLAGSAVMLDACVSHVLTTGLATLADAVAMAAIRPRELLGLPVPRIAVGEPAEFALVERNNGSGAF